MTDHGRRAPRRSTAFVVVSIALLIGATASPAGADCDANCVDCVPGPTCTACADGFRLNLATNDCDDVDECAIGNGGCDANAACTNTSGGFSCSCVAGYAGDGVTCTDVDECASGATCGVGSCINTAGSFSCDCPAGVTGDDCGVDGYLPPDRASARCANAITTRVGGYVKCVLRCRTKKTVKELADKNYDEQACASACRSTFDDKVAQLKRKGICPACLDETAQNLLADDARLYAMDVKGRGYCQATEPLAP
ncbi:hypothetical protein K2Z84_01955 [Candidatus Binatia bacterium]|nr:hypothetical protein [Candidatus Binatia bacterium]